MHNIRRTVGGLAAAAAAATSTVYVVKSGNKQIFEESTNNGENAKVFEKLEVEGKIITQEVRNSNSVKALAAFSFGSPSYTKAEVEKHNKIGDFWVTYENQVYDITSFISQHPGGSKILMAAGKAIDPYWSEYRQHNTATVQGILQQYRIGRLSDYDPNAPELQVKNPYINDPERSTDLKFHGITPCNAECPIEDEEENAGPVEYLTPNELFFIRNHHPVPDLKPDTHKVSLLGRKSMTVDEIREKYSEHSVITTIQCGGNRRKELNKYGKTSGTAWCSGAISTAKWTGVWLRDVLIDLMPEIMDEENRSGKWITLRAPDKFEISIPIEKALDPNGDCLLAYKMNDEDEFPRDHGYPLRVIVPGFAGVRNVKWIDSIELTDDEVQSPWQVGMAYKMLAHYSKQVSQSELDTLKTTQESPVQSFITTKISDLKTSFAENQGKGSIFGVAWSGGGRGIQRMEISLDSGKTWQTAEKLEGKKQNPYKAWAWVLWKLEVEESELKAGDEIICRAVDISYNTQPADMSMTWNIRGINNNAWHRVKFE